MRILYDRFIDWLNADDDNYGDLGYGVLVSLMRHVIVFLVYVVILIILVSVLYAIFPNCLIFKV